MSLDPTNMPLPPPPPLPPVAPAAGAAKKNWTVVSAIKDLASKIWNAVLWFFGFSKNEEIEVIAVPVLPPPPIQRSKQEIEAEMAQNLHNFRANGGNAVQINFNGRPNIPDYSEIGKNSPANYNDGNNIRRQGQVGADVDINLSLPNAFDTANLSKDAHKAIAAELAGYVRTINNSSGDASFGSKKLPQAQRTDVYNRLTALKGEFEQMPVYVKRLTDAIAALNDSETTPTVKKLLMMAHSPDIAQRESAILQKLTEFRQKDGQANANVQDMALTGDAGDFANFETIKRLESEIDDLVRGLPQKLSREIDAVNSLKRAANLIREKAEDSSELTRLSGLKFKLANVQEAQNKRLIELDAAIDVADEKEVGNLREDKQAEVEGYQDHLGSLNRQIASLRNQLKLNEPLQPYVEKESKVWDNPDYGSAE